MTVSFEQIEKNEFDLIVDEVYVGGTKGNISDEIISKIFGVSNTSGIRFLNSDTVLPKIMVLYSDGENIDWPDYIDLETGTLTYYGDNRKPGHDIHSKKGNQKINEIFKALYKENRDNIPPIFLMWKHPIPNSRSMKFMGLLVPGTIKKSNEDLIAMWFIKRNERFQNYKIKFTVLNENRIKNEWLKDIKNGNAICSKHAPKSWVQWIKSGKINPLLAKKTNEVKSKIDQLPKGKSLENKILIELNNHFEKIENGDYYFEKFVNYTLSKYWDDNVIRIENTPRSKDGGIDGLGTYRIGGQSGSRMNVQFYIQSKRYRDVSVGVRDVARLISRIKYRQFGVMVTTSYVNKQALKEVQEDKHPIIFISGIDLVDILKKAHIGSVKRLKQALLLNDDDNYDY